MQFCPTCGAPIEVGSKVCVSCGADLTSPPVEPPVEKLTIESCGVALGYTTLRVRNSGTAPLTVTRVTFGSETIMVRGIYSGSGTLKGDMVSLQPGEAVTISLEQSPMAISGNEYPVMVLTTSGKTYSTSLVWP